MSLIDISDERRNNPVDVVEHLAAIKEWAFDRAADDEIAISVKGRWTDYHLSFTWMDEIESLHLACAFDLRVPERRRIEVLQLISHVNEQLWLGHFDVWSRDGVIMFRHALILAGGVEASGRQCEVLLDGQKVASIPLTTETNPSGLSYLRIRGSSKHPEEDHRGLVIASVAANVESD